MFEFYTRNVANCIFDFYDCDSHDHIDSRSDTFLSNITEFEVDDKLFWNDFTNIDKSKLFWNYSTSPNESKLMSGTSPWDITLIKEDDLILALYNGSPTNDIRFYYSLILIKQNDDGKDVKNRNVQQNLQTNQ